MHTFLNPLFHGILTDQKFICCLTVKYSAFLKNATHMCFERKHQGALMFTQHCIVSFIAAVRGAAKPDISAVKMYILMTAIWISYNRKGTGIADCFCQMS